jgi:hypothetical protein
MHAPPRHRNKLIIAIVSLAAGRYAVATAAAQCESNWSNSGESGPSPRQNHAVVYDRQRGVVVLFGGYRGGFGFYDDTWEWDGASWTHVQTTGPPSRGNFAMAYDGARNKTVLFGGAGAGGSFLGDTWEYDGSTHAWTQVFPAATPSPRYNAAMAFDAAHGRSLLFGGYSGVREGDTWTWDGTIWTQVATSGCTPRNGHSMAYDDGRQVIVLFGGYNGARLGDTWEWNGFAWSQRSVTGPSGRQYVGLTYHDERHRIMLFGGQVEGCSYCREDDTWEWDGAIWTLLGDGQASIRDQHSLVYHAASDQLMLFGGYAGGGFVLDDTWIWREHSLVGDLDFDGAVGLQDLALFLAHFGATSGASPDDGDFDGDEDVDLADLAALLANFGESCR